ncbi:MAG: response regulator transcription factor [Clostridia bacterium]|nr:response regulator transcription factor [Clostridia bacterium]
MINVLIVEDDPMASQLMEVYLSKGGNYNLVQTVESAMFAEVVCKSKPVDIVLMDVCTALNANGIEAAKNIKKSFPEIKIIIITSQPEHSFIERAKAAGVESFWYKNGAAEELLSVMERTIFGEKVYPETTPTVKLGDSYSEKLSDRELEVLREVVAGETDAAIAEKLHMSLRTVKQHIQSMRDKTGFRNRTELAVKARESGLVIN